MTESWENKTLPGRAAGCLSQHEIGRGWLKYGRWMMPEPCPCLFREGETVAILYRCAQMVKPVHGRKSP